MTTKKAKIWNFIDHLEGDKVVWIIVLVLMMISLLCMFSSTSRMATEANTRVNIFMDQLKTVAASLILIIILYNIKSVKFFKFIAAAGFIGSVILLSLLAIKINTSFIKAPEINGAHRILEIKGFQVHVLEIVKVAMVLYLAYAIDGIKKDTLYLRKHISPKLQKYVYIYFPFCIILVLSILASNSAALLIGVVMYFVILLGGGNTKEMILLALAGLLTLGFCFGIYKASDGKAFKRIGTAVGRVLEKNIDQEQIFLDAKPYSTEYYQALDEIRQSGSARIAIHQGGLIGKLPGQSTQKYKVSLISEDYIFSFIVEEYGLIGALIILSLYLSLLARASIIARGLKKDLFGQLCVGGLSLLISGQAMLHIFVNVDIGIMTGQTLPMVSHGKSALLCFSFAFGVILSMSRIAKRNTDKELRDAEPLVAEIKEEVQTQTFVEDEL